jgi:hypothetical protein
MAQVGVLSLSQLQLHDHYNLNSGGPILTIARANSANIRITNAALVADTGVGADTMLKRTVILQDTTGAMTIVYDGELTPGAGGNSCHIQAHIFRAGVAIWNGTNNVVAAAGLVAYTDANIVLNLLAGDCIEVWGHIVVGIAESVEVSNLTIRYDATITEISRYGLTVALAVSDEGILYENVA